MSYYTVPDSPCIYFGQSLGADQWIEKNVEGAARTRAVKLTPTPPVELAPGVLRYVAKKGKAL